MFLLLHAGADAAAHLLVGGCINFRWLGARALHVSMTRFSTAWATSCNWLCQLFWFP